MKNNYEISFHTYDHPKNVDFSQHIHEYAEIFVFLEGCSSYEVEATSYSLDNNDILIIPAHKLHGIRHHANKKYSRIVIYIEDDFFSNMNCPEYINTFRIDHSIKIPGVLAEVYGLKGIIDNFIKYSNNFRTPYTKISEACLIELIHVLSNINEQSMPVIRNNNIQNIISYINNEYKNDITLDELSEKFYISKYHLCREFKKLTGHTIHEYINIRKFQKVKELCDSGLSISDACTRAGFNSYSSFYRYYRKNFSDAPGNWLKN